MPKIAVFIGRSPDTASFEDIRRFRLQVAASSVGAGAINRNVSALRFFFRGTLKRYAIIEHTHLIYESRKLPVVLNPEEVVHLLDAAPGLKSKAALSVACDAGLRVAEVVALKVSDIDSKRMLIRVEQGKGRKDRNVMLAPHLLEVLRVVEGSATTRLAVSRPRPGGANDDAPAQSRLPCHSADCRDQQARSTTCHRE